MNYAGFLLRQERLNRNWSQEGLCSGICTVSYLSKIEQGKAVPSDEVIRLLMQRMDLPWILSSPEMRESVEAFYEALLSFDQNLASRISQSDAHQYLYSPFGADWLLLQQIVLHPGQPLAEELEVCLDNRQLALQRMLQGRYEEAVQLYPAAFSYCAVGSHYYGKGQITAALEAFQTGYQLAAGEGRPRVMLYCKTLMGNCYSNQHDLDTMQRHYAVARRLASALGNAEILSSIDYNTAATQLETGQYEKALSYFQKLEHPSRMDLHKLAICCEKLGMHRQALDALGRAQDAAANPQIPAQLETQMLHIVGLRLNDPEYLKNPQYGTLLLECFQRCRKELSSGYAVFHLPWVLEWYEANRQYKQALQLMKHFPDSGRKEYFQR